MNEGTRYEAERELDVSVGIELVRRGGARVAKTRHSVWLGDDGWVVDTFAGGNAPLMIAEVERGGPVTDLTIPAFCVTEVTSDPRFSNDALAGTPVRHVVRRVRGRAGRPRAAVPGEPRAQPPRGRPRRLAHPAAVPASGHPRRSGFAAASWAASPARCSSACRRPYVKVLSPSSSAWWASRRSVSCRVTASCCAPRTSCTRCARVALRRAGVPTALPRRPRWRTGRAAPPCGPRAAPRRAPPRRRLPRRPPARGRDGPTRGGRGEGGPSAALREASGPVGRSCARVATSSANRADASQASSRSCASEAGGGAVLVDPLLDGPTTSRGVLVREPAPQRVALDVGVPGGAEHVPELGQLVAQRIGDLAVQHRAVHGQGRAQPPGGHPGVVHGVVVPVPHRRGPRRAAARPGSRRTPARPRPRIPSVEPGTPPGVPRAPRGLSRAARQAVRPVVPRMLSVVRDQEVDPCRWADDVLRRRSPGRRARRSPGARTTGERSSPPRRRARPPRPPRPTPTPVSAQVGSTGRGRDGPAGRHARRTRRSRRRARSS